MYASSALGTVAIKEETTYGVEPATGYKPMSIVNDTLVLGINTVQSEEATPDATNPPIRGGNMRVQGDLTMDFGVSRHGTFYKHLLRASVASAAASPTALAAGAVAVGDMRTCLGQVYVCLIAGTLANGTATAVTADNTDNTLTYGASHGLVTGERVILAATDVPTGLVAGAYFVRVVSPTIVTLYPTYADAVANTNMETFTTDGTDVTLAASPLLNVSQGLTQTLQGTKWLHVGAASLTLYKHVFTRGTAFPTGGFAIEKGVIGGDTNMYQTFLGCRINQLQLTISQEQLIRTVWSFVGTSATALTTTAHGTPASATPDNPIMGFDTVLVLNNGLVAPAVSEASVNITNNVTDDLFILESRFRQDVPAGIHQITGSMTVFFRDLTEYNLFRNETTFPMTFAIHNRAAGQVFLLELMECRMTGEPSQTVAQQGVVSSQYDFTAFKQNATTDVKLTIIDTNAALL